MEIINNFFLNLQKRNPLNLCRFFPIDPRKYVLICKEDKLYFMKRRVKLDLVCLLKPTCLYCVSMFISGKYIPHCAEQHISIVLHEHAIFNKAYMKYKIKEMIFPGFFDDPNPFTSRFSKTAFNQYNGIVSKKKEIIENNDEVYNKNEIEENPEKVKAHIDSVSNEKNKSVKNLIVSPHPLNANFSKGRFYKFYIDIRNSDGYVRANSIRENASNLNDDEKNVKMWKKNKKVQEYVIVVSKNLNLSPNSLIISVTDVCNDLRGIYIHPKLIVDYASWISAEFKFYTEEIVLEFFNAEKAKKLKAELKKTKIELKKSKNKIKKKEDKIDQLTEKIDCILESNKRLEKTVNRTDRTLTNICTYAETRNRRLTVAVPPSKSHIFVIWRVIPNKSSHLFGKINRYAMARILKNSYRITKKNRMADLDAELKTIYKIAFANPIELSSEVVKILGVKRHHSSIELLFYEDSIEKTEENFIAEVQKIVNRDIDDYISILNENDDDVN